MPRCVRRHRAFGSMRIRLPAGRGRALLAVGMWTSLTRGCGQLAQLIIVVTAARYLGPAEFGVFALVSAVAFVLLRVAEAGWSEFIISWRGDDTAYQGAMTAGLAAGGLLASVGLCAAFVLEMFEAGPATAPLMALFSIWVLLSTLAAVQGGILVKRERVVRLSILQIAGEAVGLAVTLLSLAHGDGVLALIYGRLAQQILLVGVGFALTRVFPGHLPDRAMRVAMSDFYRNILLARLLAILRLYAATFLIGAFLGPASVGFYRVAERLMGAFGELLGEPVRMLAWLTLGPAARRVGSDPAAIRAALRETANRYFPLMVALAVPPFVLVGMYTSEIVVFVLGEEWRAAAPIAAILAGARLVLVPAAATEVVLSLVGEVRRAPRISLINCVVAVVLVLIAAQFDTIAVAFAELAGSIVAFATTVWLQSRYGGIDWREIGRRSLFVVPALAVGIGCAYGISEALAGVALPAIVRAILACIVALLAYAAVVLAIRPEAVRAVTRHTPQQPDAVPAR